MQNKLKKHTKCKYQLVSWVQIWTVVFHLTNYLLAFDNTFLKFNKNTHSYCTIYFVH